MRSKNNFFCFILFISCFLNAQVKPSINYTTADGLQNNAVRALFLDNRDDLWIGTENGISKLENGSFTHLKLPKNITNTSCWDINQDSQNNMWFASYAGGVYKLEGKNFTVFNNKSGLPSINIRKLFAYKNYMYVGTELGVAMIDIKTNKIVVPKGILPHFGVFIVSDFFIYKNEIYFTAINEGIFKIAYKKSIPIIEPVYKFEHCYSLGFHNQTLYTANKGFINVFKIQNLISGQAAPKKFGKTTAWDFVKDKYNQLYTATWGVYDSSGGLYTIVNNEMKNISAEYGIDSKNLLNVVYSHKKDILYVGSKDKGIYEIQLDETIDYNPFDNKKIIDFEFLENKKIILHQAGVSILDAHNVVTKTISLTDFKKGEENFIKTTKQKLPTHEDGYYELDYNLKASEIEFYELVKHQQALWITSSIGVFELNFAGKIIHYAPIHSYKIGFTNTNKFIETIPYEGVRLYDDVYHLKAKHYEASQIHTPQNIVGIVNNTNQTYLISVFQGLFLYQNNAFQSLLNDKIWNEKRLKFITKNEKNQLIIASEFGGLSLIANSKSFKVLKTIPKNKIIGNTKNFLEAYKDYIFIGTEKGINIYKNGNIQLFDKEQGLKDADIKCSAIYKDQLYLGTQKGYYTLDLKKLTAQKTTVNQLNIETIAINSKLITATKNSGYSYQNNQLICDYEHNTFEVAFIPKGHIFPHKLSYRYRLKNSNSWSPYTDKSFVYLSYLPQGNYQLEIEVLDRHAGKKTDFKLLTIIIQPPFWQTGWFYGLLILAIILIAILIVIRIKKRTKAKAAVENKIAKAKLEALLSQMNPHFTFNALNAIQGFVFNNDARNSTIYISEVASLMRQTLDNSTNQTINIEDEITYLQSYIKLENLRFQNSIHHTITVDENLNQERTQIPTMLLQPFVENIFKHAFDNDFPNPVFSIDFKKTDANLLEITIKDNGKGQRKSNQTHVSRGLSITTQRLQLMQPTNTNPINMDFSPNGTTIIIKLII